MSAARTLGRLIAIVLILIVLGIAWMAWSLRHVAQAPAQATKAVGAAALLTQAIPDATPNAEQVRRGQYLVRTGDCLSCHLTPGGQPFAGGLPLNTPFGIIYSSNISSDKTHGIGDWTPDQFYAAMHDGVGAHGERLYPAFPYPWFTHVSRADDDAILAFLKTTPSSDAVPPANQLPFPLNIRMAVMGWDLLFLKKSEFTPDANQSPEWNRGAAIVNGLGHCGACHTPKNLLGADKSGAYLQSGVLENFVAPDLTANAKTGLGSWSLDDITEYLHTGRNARAGAGGPMAEVITYSTSLMTDEDRHAIAVYLKAQAASPMKTATSSDPAAIKRGAEVYSDACSSCHLADGAGQPRYFPPLGKNAVVQQNDATGVLHIILAGSRVGPSPTRPSPMTMPSFAWKLSDQETADVAIFLRNSWGNQAGPVSSADVQTVRKKLDLTTNHLTDNSGDQP